MPEITECTNSTVTEAWFVVSGPPYNLGLEDQTESAVVLNGLQKRHPESSVVPTVTLVSSDAVLVSPFFRSELQLKDQKRIRLGYRFLSGHSIHSTNSKYEGFSKELLSIATELVTDAKNAIVKPESAKIDVVAFGYKNEFAVETVNDLDLSEFFKVAFGVFPQGNRTTLLLNSLSADFTFLDSETQLSYIFSIRGEQPNPNVKAFVIRTNTLCKVNSNLLTFSHTTEVLAKINDCRLSARRFFFDLTSPKTRAIMGAR